MGNIVSGRKKKDISLEDCEGDNNAAFDKLSKKKSKKEKKKSKRKSKKQKKHLKPPTFIITPPSDVEDNLEDQEETEQRAEDANPDKAKNNESSFHNNGVVKPQTQTA